MARPTFSSQLRSFLSTAKEMSGQSTQEGLVSFLPSLPLALDRSDLHTSA